MDDKCMMEDLLMMTKGVCDLYMHATVESATPNVHTAFDAALKDTLCMQNDIYNKMSQKGWYPTTQAEPQKVQQVVQKFSANQMAN